ncbi:unnamed protein product [Lampetra planeri]
MGRGTGPPLWLGALLGAALCTSARGPARPACPPGCRCDGRIVYCESLGLSDLPADASPRAHGLSLRYNALRELGDGAFARFRHLTWLYLDHNHVGPVAADAFRGIRKLKELILTSNRVSRLSNSTFSVVPNLRNLDLSYNRLRRLEPRLFGALRKLQTLHLRANALRALPPLLFRDCRSLEFLDLGHNRLRSVSRRTFAGLPRLAELHLENNRLVRLNLALFSRLLGLQMLYAQWNRVAEVIRGEPPWVWSSLRKLDLAGNELVALSADTLAGVPNLQTLHLDSNRLRVLGGEALATLRSLRTITAAGNRWECERPLCPLAEWLWETRGQWEGSVKCTSPQQLEGTTVLDAMHGRAVCSARPEPPAPPAPPRPRAPPAAPEGGGAESNRSVLRAPPQPPPPPEPPVPPAAPSATPGSEADMERLPLHKVVTGCAALLLSVGLILLVTYASWRRYPDTLRRLQEAQVRGPERAGWARAGLVAGLGSSLRGSVVAAEPPGIPMEYYVDFKLPGEAAAAERARLVLPNGLAAPHGLGADSRQCEV